MVLDKSCECVCVRVEVGGVQERSKPFTLGEKRKESNNKEKAHT